MKTLALIATLVIAADAFACSPPYVEPVQFDPSAAYEGESPPNAPVVRVAEITRGRPAGRGENTCVEMSWVTIAVRDDSPHAPYYFAFRELGGNAPDLIFQNGLRSGGLNDKGELLFTFYWPELSKKRVKINLRVEVTPYTRSGIEGETVEFIVKESEI
jgi:hypothetical protein